jgi:tRNA uridine 5-carbamoylmethylation protein Kti12
MNNYDFSTINDKDFEILVRDLLNAKFDFKLQSFKLGKDKGIDLRFSIPENSNNLVVQAKHYLKSGYSKLKSILKNDELPKVNLLKPDRYIVATSLPLAPQNKDELKKIFSPFILSENDIIGQEDLNQYLADFPEIEKRHFKLWFSSVNIIESIINNGIDGRSQSFLKEIQEKIPFYVITERLDDADKILNDCKLLLITGQPGIGKTTLAEMLICDWASKGVKIHKVENIAEAENSITKNEEDKQLFFFDDFLGANYNEIVGAGKTESQLTSFVKRVQSTPNKYLVLATRTIILNQARQKYEKISHLNLSRSQFEIELKNYTKYEKALILYNHCYFHGLRKELYEEILNEKFYKHIITHPNYTPRIVEFITVKSKVADYTAQEYHKFILDNLNNPQGIWDYSFREQIEYPDRCLLLTLHSFQKEVEEKWLQEAFHLRMQFEKNTNNQVLRANQFNDSLKVLVGGFVKSAIYEESYNQRGNVRHYTFVNPSLGDFLLNYVKSSRDEIYSILKSVRFVEQLVNFNPRLVQIPLEKDAQVIIRDRITSGEITFITQSTSIQNKLAIAATLCRFCMDVSVDHQLMELLEVIHSNNGYSESISDTFYVLLHVKKASNAFTFLKSNFYQIIGILTAVIGDADDANEIPSIFEQFDENYEAYVDTTEGHSVIYGMVNSIIQSYIRDEVDNRKQDMLDMSDVDDMYDELTAFAKELTNEVLPGLLFSKYDFDLDYDESEWEEIINENIEDDAENNSSQEGSGIKYIKSDEPDEDGAIDQLFS